MNDRKIADVIIDYFIKLKNTAFELDRYDVVQNIDEVFAFIKELSEENQIKQKAELQKLLIKESKFKK